MSPAVRFLILSFLFLSLSVGQSPNGTISGIVHDPSDRPIPDAEILIVNDLTNIQYQTKTSDEGIYVVTNLPPGPYRIQVTKRGFKTLIKPGLVLNVQDALSVSVTLPLGAVAEVVTVEAGAPLINTTDGAVSTVVDRQFAENLPMNGRSFQTLIQLAPGVVVTPSTAADGGQFSVNGQRAGSNYWMVDGVSANIGMSSTAGAGNGLGGALGSFSVLGGTNSLVSVDALQEFRIQTSTYAPEFGRTPGAQISILTRSGTNRFHGTLFDYLRNDRFDANDWFADFAGLRKPQERQNDFGGTFAGPVRKDRTFFFFSYEGLRLRLPQTALTSVPDASFTPGGTTNSRQNAVPGLQPYLNAFPLPNPDSPEIFVQCDPTTDPSCPLTGQKPTGSADFNASYSNAATLDAYSIRIDHKFYEKLGIFGRYNYSPSQALTRGDNRSLSVVHPSRIDTETFTIGATWLLSHLASNDLRFNYSRTNASGRYYQDQFGGAVPLVSLPLPNPFTTDNALFQFEVFSLKNSNLGFAEGKLAGNYQRQFNIVDNVSFQAGSHSLKFGVDFRHLSPFFAPVSYSQIARFTDVPSAEQGNLDFSLVYFQQPTALLFKNLGLFGQDTWRIKPKLTLTYGLRWDVDFAPSPNSGPNLLAVTGFDLTNLANLALAPTGTPPFSTTYGNIAPRIGVAYQVSPKQSWQSVLRGGFGVFYDLVTSQAGNVFDSATYPFGNFAFNFGGTFPLNSAEAAPPQIIIPDASNGQTLFALDPHLRLPYTLEWNVALEQGFGDQQTVSTSYVGATGRRLLQAADIISPNPSYAAAQLTSNAATSSYNALQVQFDRRLSHGLQALVSYTWSHSIDDASAGSDGTGSNRLVSAVNPKANRGSSDFDIRSAFSAGVSYEVPTPRINAFAGAILRGWSLQSLVQARSAPPVDVSDGAFNQLNTGFQANIRPDLVPGQPLYLSGSQCAAVFGPLGSPCAGGKGFNPAAFTDPPVDGSTGNPIRQGNVPRNFLRGFGATQWDFAVHRDFPIRDYLKLQFRAEMFNVLNHPNFAPPSGAFLSPQNGGPGSFGVSSTMLGKFFNGGNSGTSNTGGGAFSPLYQIGGPRSMQFALKLFF
jgi:hypothetical protein